MIYSANLIPASRRAARTVRSRAVMWGAIGAVYCALVAGGLVTSHIVLGGAYHNAAVDLENENTHIKQLMSEGVDLRKQLGEAIALRESVREVTDQPDWSIVLTALPVLGGEEMVLKEVKLHPVETKAALVSTATKKETKTPVNARRFTLEIKGDGKSQPSVAKFVLALQQANVFDEVKLVRMGREPFMDETAVGFEVLCTMGDAGGVVGGNAK